MADLCQLQLVGSRGKFKLLKGKVALGLPYRDSDVVSNTSKSQTTIEKTTSYSGDSTILTETTTTVTTKSTTLPKGKDTQADVSPVTHTHKAIITTNSQAKRWTVELVDAVKQLFVIKVDGVPVGEEDGSLFAFFDENDHPEVTHWKITPAEMLQTHSVGGDLIQALKTSKVVKNPNRFWIQSAESSYPWYIPDGLGKQVSTLPPIYRYLVSYEKDSITRFALRDTGSTSVLLKTSEKDKADIWTIEQIGISCVMKINNAPIVERDGSLVAVEDGSDEEITRWLLLDAKTAEPVTLGESHKVAIAKDDFSKVWKAPGDDGGQLQVAASVDPSLEIFTIEHRYVTWPNSSTN